MEDVFLKTKDYEYINLTWSSNPPESKNATGVIGIYVYNEDGSEGDGGEMDIFDNKELRDHINDALEFIDLVKDYEIISEEEFDQGIINNEQNAIYGNKISHVW